MKAKPRTAGLYIYAIGPEASLRSALETGSPPDSIEPGPPLALVTQGKLAAVVSEVPLSKYDEGHFEENLNNAAWAADKVMRHQQVTQFLSAATPIVPIRFGVLYSGPERIRQMLAGRHEKLEQMLDKVKNHEEWGLNVYVARAVLNEKINALSPQLAELKRKAAIASPGQSYLLDKKREGLRSTELRTYTRQIADSIRDSLRTRAEDLRELPVREHESKQEPAMAAKLSFLIRRSRLTSFQRAAERLAKKHASDGVTLELTGPWPPYNFTE